MKKCLTLSVLFISCVAASTRHTDVVEDLYNQLVQRSTRIDVDNEEQRGSLCDVLAEAKQIVDDCNSSLKKVLTKYPELYKQLNLRGALTLNLVVDTDAQ